MYVIVSVKLQDEARANGVKLCDAKRFNVGSFQEAAKILDRILKFLSKLPNAKEEE